jgi:hypothetical protein
VANQAVGACIRRSISPGSAGGASASSASESAPVALDTVSDCHLTRPTDVPGQAIGQADYVLIAEIVAVERFKQQGAEQVQRLADDLEHLVSSRGMLVVRPVL